MKNEIEYRVTRRKPYDNPNCFGHKDLSARQGHYYFATDLVDLGRQLEKDRFDKDIDIQFKDSSGRYVQLHYQTYPAKVGSHP